jgi:hypothetical protein
MFGTIILRGHLIASNEAVYLLDLIQSICAYRIKHIIVYPMRR